MYSKPTLKKKLAAMQREASKGGPVSSPAAPNGAMVDIGDWALAQDQDGSLIIYNVTTGNKVILARP